MSRSDRQHSSGNADNKRNRAGRAAALLRPAVARLRPLAKRADTTTRHQASKARAWAGPQLDRAGQVLQDDVAPKVSGLLSSAARRVEPKTQRQPRWRKLTVGASAATAAAGALAAAARLRGKRAGAAPDLADAAQSESESTEQMPGEQPRTSPDAANDAPVRTS